MFSVFKRSDKNLELYYSTYTFLLFPLDELRLQQ